MTQEEFEKKAKALFGNKYDLSKAIYKNNKTKIKIKCNDCGSEYEQLAQSFLAGHNGCPKCSKLKSAKEKYLDRIKQIHGNHYDYSLVNYKNNSSKIKLLCKKKNVIFEQTASTVLNKKIGCPVCSKKLKKTTEQFIEEAKLVHGDTYDYSLVNYKNNITKVKIICHKIDENGKEHGLFEQIPTNHLLQKQGCPKCFGTKLKSIEQFVEEAKLIHGDIYDYSLVNYKNNRTKVKIICKKCGKVFKQTPTNHLSGKGCPCCKESKGEKKIKLYLKKNNKTFKQTKMFNNLKDKFFLSYDFYLPDNNLLIEFNGIQHYKQIKKFQPTLHDFHRQLHHDWLKRKYARDNDIKLLTIPYWEFDNIDSILKEELD